MEGYNLQTFREAYTALLERSETSCERQPSRITICASQHRKQLPEPNLEAHDRHLTSGGEIRPAISFPMGRSEEKG
jgi:hypothetical protein